MTSHSVDLISVASWFDMGHYVKLVCVPWFICQATTNLILTGKSRSDRILRQHPVHDFSPVSLSIRFYRLRDGSTMSHGLMTALIRKTAQTGGFATLLSLACVIAQGA
jgi:hypothetical protein